MENIYDEIARRTGGNIYIGVVGPVRTGKSTFIKRIMETLVIPNMEDPYRKERARDELPQSGSGKTIMTSEPKFVPEEAAEISPDGASRFRIRMIDSVGYMVDGAVGAEENGTPRLVTTPWFDHEIPMTEAAELGTKKVMEDHCSIGIVITTDGSVTDIPREDYLTAEHRAITDMAATGKPFLVIVNTKDPRSPQAAETKTYLDREFSLNCLIADCQTMDTDTIGTVLKSLLYRFPMTRLQVYMPRWIDALEAGHPVKTAVWDALRAGAEKIDTLEHAESALSGLSELDCVQDYSLKEIDPGSGTVSITLAFPETLFYEILSARAGMPVESDAQLLNLLTELAQTKREYDQISDALTAARTTGYGVVMPSAAEMTLQKPELTRKGGAYGVRLKAGAPSIHMIRVDIDTQISPMVGDEKQSKDLVDYLSSEDPEALWKSNIFGKSVFEMVQEGMTAKLLKTPPEVREKFRGSLSRVVNEGANGMICLIL